MNEARKYPGKLAEKMAGALKFTELYSNLEELGRGGFGVVHKVQHKSSKLLYALKTIRADGLNPKARQSLDREISILKQISHDNIVTFHSHFIDNDTVSLLMEFCPNGDLRAAIAAQKQSGRPFSEEQLLSWNEDIFRATAYLYDNHIIHRDIKPENLLLSATFTIKLTDFGISKIQGLNYQVMGIL